MDKTFACRKTVMLCRRHEDGVTEGVSKAFSAGNRPVGKAQVTQVERKRERKCQRIRKPLGIE